MKVKSLVDDSLTGSGQEVGGAPIIIAVACILLALALIVLASASLLLAM